MVAYGEESCPRLCSLNDSSMLSEVIMKLHSTSSTFSFFCDRFFLYVSRMRKFFTSLSLVFRPCDTSESLNCAIPDRSDYSTSEKLSPNPLQNYGRSFNRTLNGSRQIAREYNTVGKTLQLNAIKTMSRYHKLCYPFAAQIEDENLKKFEWTGDWIRIDTGHSGMFQ